MALNYSKIITTVNSVTQNISIIPDQHNVIVIDTSDNRLGINTINPQHSIDVRDNPDISGIIHGDHIKTSTVMSDLTPDIDICYNLGSQTNRWNRIDASYLEVTGINIKDATKFSIGEGSAENGITFPLNVNVNGDITANDLIVDGINIRDSSKFIIGEGSGNNNGIEFPVTTTISGDLIISGDISSQYLVNLITGNRASISVSATSLTQNDYYGLYRGQQLLSDYTTGDIGIEASGLQQTIVVSTQSTGDAGFFIGNQLRPSLTLIKNTLYTFDLSNVDLVTHPFRIYTDNTRAIEYQGAVIDGSFLYLTVTDSVTSLYYGCENHSDMGNYINIDVVYRKFNIRFTENSEADDVPNIQYYNIFNFNNLDVIASENNQILQNDLSGIVINDSYDRYKTLLDINYTITNNYINDIIFEISLFKNSNVIHRYQNTIDFQSTQSQVQIPQYSTTGAYSENDHLELGFLFYVSNYNVTSINNDVNITNGYIENLFNNYDYGYYGYNMYHWNYRSHNFPDRDKEFNSLHGTEPYSDGGNQTHEQHNDDFRLNLLNLSIPIGYQNWLSWPNRATYYTNQDDAVWYENYVNWYSKDMGLNGNVETFDVLDSNYVSNARAIALQNSSNKYIDISESVVTILVENIENIDIIIDVSTSLGIVASENLINAANRGVSFGTKYKCYYIFYLVRSRYNNPTGLYDETVIDNKVFISDKMDDSTGSYSKCTGVTTDGAIISNIDPNILNGIINNARWVNKLNFNLRNYSLQLQKNDNVIIKSIVAIQFARTYSSNIFRSGLNKWWIFYSGANTGLDYDIYLQSIDRFHLNIDTSVRTVLNDFGYNINLNFNTINLSVGKSQEQTFEDIEITNSLTLQPDAIFQAKNIDFTGIPDVSTGLSPGYLYQDNGFIKIVL